MTRTDPTVMPTDPDLQAAARFRDSQATRGRSAAHRPQLPVVLISPTDSRVHAHYWSGGTTPDCTAVFSTVPADQSQSTDQP